MGGQAEERSGSWNNGARNVRCAYRNRNNPDNRNDNSGFRALLQLTWLKDFIVTGQNVVAPRTGGVCRGELARPVPGRWSFVEPCEGSERTAGQISHWLCPLALCARGRAASG